MSGKRLWLWGIGLAIATAVTGPLNGRTPYDIKEGFAAMFALLVGQGLILLGSHLWRTYLVRIERREEGAA